MLEPTELFRDIDITGLEDVKVSTLEISDATRDMVEGLLAGAAAADAMAAAMSDSGATALEAIQASTRAHNERHAIITQNIKEEIDDIDDQIDAIKRLTKEQQIMASIATKAFTAFGKAFAETAIEGGNIFKEAMKAAIASAVEAIAMLAMAHAGYALVALNFAKAAALFAAGTVAFATAAGIRALGTGGLVTGPTVALLGERGPERVTPVGKEGTAGGITLNVYGSLITEDTLLQAIESRVMGRLTRVY